ncbi:hypothetical protein [Microbispora siamensis]|uniref:hypothetical protein n=1 Tax=Microbispora siamensis TaxID=564413 RepID=UPI0019513B76|nr:hypothetical protein [Microbispora siamensis]
MRERWPSAAARASSMCTRAAPTAAWIFPCRSISTAQLSMRAASVATTPCAPALRATIVMLDTPSAISRASAAPVRSRSALTW